MLLSGKPVNVATVPQRSPFRYPGGKTWFVPFVRMWLHSLPRRPTLFVEPFAGGGIIGLTVAAERRAERVILVELDEAVASVWRTMLSADAGWLIARVLAFDVSRDSVERELRRGARSDRELAFQTLLRNRVQRAGIMAPGASLVRRGENGRGLRSRWYPQTLARRIQEIRDMRDRLEFIHGDGLEVIERLHRQEGCAFFVDPPYTAGGKRAGQRLYTHNDVDHRRLFEILSRAAGPVMMTYDESAEVLALGRRYGFCAHLVPMKNAHHTTMRELVLTDAGSRLPAIQNADPLLFD